jgi:putative PIN family toxin of toxin-antitoxin system
MTQSTSSGPVGSDPPRLILDANVLLNAITAPPNTILGRLNSRFRRFEIRVVFSEALLTEFQQILEYPRIKAQFKLGAADGFAVARDLLLLGEYVSPVPAHGHGAYVPRFDWPTLTDPKDWYLLDLLFEARTDALVTQDSAVLKAGTALGLPVLHPRDLRAAGLV